MVLTQGTRSLVGVAGRSWGASGVASSTRGCPRTVCVFVPLCVFTAADAVWGGQGTSRRSAATMSTPVLRCELCDVPSMDQHEQPSSAAHQHTLSNPGGLCFMFSREPLPFPFPSDGRPLCVAHHARREMFGPSVAGGVHVSRPGRPLRSAPHRCIFEMLGSRAYAVCSTHRLTPLCVCKCILSRCSMPFTY